ncbi:hypothetical protein AB0D56_38785, partial [Streptomyces sp. NPDC048209]
TADASAARAALSATTARKALSDAVAATSRAINSAASAQYSANWANESASAARTAAKSAWDSSISAQQDRDAADKAYRDAFATAVELDKRDMADWLREQDNLRKVAAQAKAQQGQQQDQQDDSWIPSWLSGAADSAWDLAKPFLNPDIWIGAGETAIGVSAMGAGVTEDVAGGVVCLTGVGCLVGAPAIVMGTTLVVGGAAVTVDGMDRFSNGIKTALREAQESGGASRGASHPIDESAKTFDSEERKVADLLAGEGRHVKAVLESRKDGQRTYDALVDGVPTEFKSLRPGATSGTVKNQLNSAKGQAMDAIVDARGSGRVEAAAREGGVKFRVANPRGRMDSCRVG